MKKETPKEKAQELFDEMWHTISDGTLDANQCNPMAKECALIAAHETLEYIVWQMGSVDNSLEWHSHIDYWNYVIQEIKNL